MTYHKGNLHPITQFNRLSIKFFTDRGFQIYEGNEIETEWYNFDALNIPDNHPSRDVQDTFWLKNKKYLLRTHNTASEPRIVKENNIKPPFKIIVPGRDFRNERTDNTHEHTFNQIDGIYVDKDVNMSHLIGVLSDWMKTIFGNKINIRIRPHLFPFVEPGLEMDVQLSDGKWREMLGAGMAHPVVLKNMGIDPEKWQAIMWGTGIDRYAMLKWSIDDIRLFNSQDLRFLKQF
jgi:phenylalanyl-tRNA synthetase alpha chain